MKKHEEGYVLIVVLLLIIVFSVLSVSLISINSSASKQFEKKEEQVKARHLAEMGIIHYKAELNKRIQNHVTIIKSKKTKEEINKENLKLCNFLDKTVEDINLNEKNKYKISRINKIGCTSTDENIYIYISSTGTTDKGTKSTIGYDITIDRTLHLSDSGSGKDENPSQPPGLPVPSNPENISKEWPCNSKKCEGSVNMHTDVSGVSGKETVSAKQGNLKFKDNLVIGTLRVDGGSIFNLTVEKDLYIKGKLDIQNQACIMVQGNFTLKDTFDSNAQTYIFVYGNANLGFEFEGKNKVELYVSGKKYVDGIETKMVKNVPDTHKKCSLPGPKNKEGSEGETPFNPKDLEVQIVREEYIY